MYFNNIVLFHDFYYFTLMCANICSGLYIMMTKLLRKIKNLKIALYD